MEHNSSHLNPNTRNFTSFLHPKANTTAAEWVKSARNAITHERGGEANATQLFQVVAKDLAATMSMGTDVAPPDEERSLSDYLVSVVGTDISNLNDEQASVLDTFLELYSDCSRAARAGNDEAAAVTARMQVVAQNLAAGTAPGAPTKGLAARVTSVLSTGLQAVTDGVAMDSPAHRAIANGDARQLKLAIASGADVNASVLVHGTALDYAATKGAAEMVKVLVEAGATVETAGDYEGSIVQRAASTGDVEMLRALSSAGSDPLTSEWRGLTPLDHAIVDGDEAAVRALANAGVDVTGGDRFEGSPLHTACAKGNQRIASVLVELGADPNKADSDGVMPLGCAIKEGNADMISLLVKAGADPNFSDGKGWTPLTYAIRRGKKDMIGPLVKAGANPNLCDTSGWTPLRLTIASGNADMIGPLVKAGANPNFRDGKGWAPLTYAIRRGKKDMIGPLVKAGANPNFCNGSTLTPLRYAVDRGNADMIGLLVEAGADPNLYASGWTPLKYAVNQGKRDMIGPLVEAGADPNLVDPLRGTPIGNLCNEFKPSGLEDLEEKLALASELRASGARAVGAKEELCLAINYLRQERPKYARALLKVLLSGENSIVPEEFRRLKMLAHAFHLDGIGHVDSSVSAEEANESFTGKLEGSWSEGWYREMEKRTRELARTFGSTDAAEPMRELAHFLSRGAEQAALGREGIAKRVLAGKPCVITTGFVGHAVSALLFGDNLVICNRGGESRKPVEVYKMANVTKASILELLDQLERCKHEQRHGYIHFLKGLSHRFDSSEKNSTAKAIEDACELPHQWVGNCSWASAEASVWAFMALKAVGNEEVETKPMEERLAGVKEDFGAWIAYQRIRTIREYLEVVEERGSTPDHGVLRRAFATAWVMVPAADAGLRSVLEDAEAQYLRVLERTDSRRCVEFKSEKLYWSNVLGSWSPAKVMYRPLKPLPEFARSKLEARLHPLWRKVFSWHEGPPPAE